MENNTEQILNELKELRIEINFIKANMPDKEMFLSSDEEVLFEESFENEEKGDLVSSSDMKKEIEL